ncbi:MAG TPA: hypothetical protein PK711_03405 [Bacteroidales bacterium]|nr:hypothetical protein [Bacteroidales bacterium]
MKTKNALALMAFMFTLVAGCIPSLHPLYTDRDRKRMDVITGDWLSDDSSSMYRIMADPDEPSYVFTYTDLSRKGNLFTHDSSRADFIVNLVSLNGSDFMDFFPGDNDDLQNLNMLLQVHLIPAHTFAKFRVTQDTIIIWRFDPEWLEELFDENRIRISHEKMDDQIVLTASTEELQKFVSKYADDPAAYVEPEVLIRQR